MLDVIDLACRRGERRLFSHVGFSVGPGHLVSVLGRNGSGKTSLLRLLCGMLSPEQGIITWQGRNIARLKEWYLSHLTYVGHLNGIKADLTARENLESAARLAGVPVSRDAVDEALEAMGLGEAGDRPTRLLSQGQQRRAALARLWISASPLWILDEPFTALDSAAAGCLTRRVARHLGDGGTVVLTAHHTVDLPGEVVREIRLPG